MTVAPITVVIPHILHRRKELGEALESVARQYTRATEVLVCVDINPHGTLGCSMMCNQGLNGATQPYVAFLADDDFLYPNHLQLLYDAITTHDADIAYSWYENKKGDHVYIFDEFQPWDEDRMRASNYICGTILVKRETALKVGGYPTPGTEEWPDLVAEDWGFLIRMADAGAKVVGVDAKTWEYRQSPP